LDALRDARGFACDDSTYLLLSNAEFAGEAKVESLPHHGGVAAEEGLELTRLDWGLQLGATSFPKLLAQSSRSTK
jgi:hypothetical protein